MSRLSLENVEWGEFRVGDLFEEIQKGKCKNEKSETKYDDSGISYLSATNRNNGVSNFVKENNLMQKGDCIMFVNQGDGGAGYSVYKKENFIATSSTSFGYAQWVNKYTGIFVSTVLSQLKSKYSFGYGRTENRLKNDKILLPIDSKGNPDWQFMENYVKQEIKTQSQRIVLYYENKLMKLGFELLDLEVEWKEFFFTDIFKEIKRGRRLTKSNQIDGDTPYISSTGINNGVDGFISNDERVRKYANNLSLANSGSVGSCFYHKYEYIASDHITALTSEHADEYIYKFMSTIIRRLEEKYSFNREINDKRISREKLFLPIDKNGEPHWEYMSNFIKKLEKENIEKTLEHIYIYMIAKKLKKQYSFENIVWKEYFIEDICDIKSGVRLVKAEHKKGKIPFIGAVDNNNGITEFIENINNSFDKNILSVNYNGSVVETFYHPYESIFSDDVKRVAFADKSQNNEYALLFLKQMIIQQKSKYQYGYKFNGKRMARQKIILPSKNNVTPDYDFMKKYMMIQEILKIKEILEFY